MQANDVTTIRFILVQLNYVQMETFKYQHSRAEMHQSAETMAILKEK